MTEIRDSTGVDQHNPDFSITMPSTYKIIGGGAKVKYGADDGNLLYYDQMEPDGVTWSAKAKEHIRSSVAKIVVYAIGIKADIPA